MALPALLRDTLSIPVVGAPLFIVSNPDLVIEQCKAGVVGSFPALNARPTRWSASTRYGKSQPDRLACSARASGRSSGYASASSPPSADTA